MVGGPTVGECGICGDMVNEATVGKCGISGDMVSGATVGKCSIRFASDNFLVRKKDL